MSGTFSGFTLDGTNTSGGNTSVNIGTELVNGSVTANATVAGGTVLGGTGTVAIPGTGTSPSVAVSGTIDAATTTTTGILTVGSLSFSSNSTFAAELNGTTPGSNPNNGYDQVAVASGGTVNLTGATLSVNLLPNFAVVNGYQFTIIDNQGGSAVAGTFTNLPEGGVILARGAYFQITYHGGDGNDVVLTAIQAQPLIASVIVNDGNAQRSEVWSITITYTSSVTFSGGNGNAAAAFELDRISQPGVPAGTFGSPRPVTLTAVPGTNGSGQTYVTLTFSGSETDPFSTAHYGGTQYSIRVAGPSLADGRYKLHVGDYVSPDDVYNPNGPPTGLALYRIYGDATGDGVVDSTDLGLFRSSFNAHGGQTNYLLYLDSDDDGVVDSTDLGQFRVRFNVNVF